MNVISFFKNKEKEIEHMEKLYVDITDFLKEVRNRVIQHQYFDIEPAVDIVRHIINSPDLIHKFYLSTIDHNYEEDFLICHQVNALPYALKIGSALQYSQGELLELGLASLLYDVGLFMIPETITKKEGSLTESEFRTVKSHTELGREILSSYEQLHPLLPRVAYEHHERENGQGYPQRLRGKAICEFAKILGLIDTYEAMTHNRPHRKAFLQHTSAKELIGSKTQLFSSNIIKAYLEEIGLFPVGSYVRLNNKAMGEVIETSTQYPMKPIIKLLYDNRGNKVNGEDIVNLIEHPILYVIEAIHAEELKE